MSSTKINPDSLGSKSMMVTFLLWAGWREILVLHFDRGPVALHPAEEGAARSGAEARGPGCDVCLDREPSCANIREAQGMAQGSAPQTPPHNASPPLGLTSPAFGVLTLLCAVRAREHGAECQEQQGTGQTHRGPVINTAVPLNWLKIERLLFHKQSRIPYTVTQEAPDSSDWLFSITTPSQKKMCAHRAEEPNDTPGTGGGKKAAGTHTGTANPQDLQLCLRSLSCLAEIHAQGHALTINLTFIIFSQGIPFCGKANQNTSLWCVFPFQGSGKTWNASMACIRSTGISKASAPRVDGGFKSHSNFSTACHPLQPCLHRDV